MKRNLLLVSLLAAAASPSWAAPATDCAALSVSSPQAGKGGPASSFSATKVVDLSLAAAFPKAMDKTLAGSHLLTVRVYSPKGNLYQSLSAGVTSDARKPAWAAAGVSAAVTLPVAGTPIVTSSLYGPWTAEALLDGETVSCERAKFTIAP
jgi:hypothetical protein